MAYSFADLQALWTSSGGAPALAPVMAAVALAESNGNPNAACYDYVDANGKTSCSPTPNPPGATGQVDRGLWQIGSVNAGSSFDPAANARAAVSVLNSQGLGAWSTFTSGAWASQFPGGKPAALTALLRTPLATTSTAAETQVAALTGSPLVVGTHNAAAPPSSSSPSSSNAGVLQPVIDAAGSIAQEVFLGSLAIALIAGGLTWMGAIDAPRITLGVKP